MHCPQCKVHSVSSYIFKLHVVCKYWTGGTTENGIQQLHNVRDTAVHPLMYTPKGEGVLQKGRTTKLQTPHIVHLYIVRLFASLPTFNTCNCRGFKNCACLSSKRHLEVAFAPCLSFPRHQVCFMYCELHQIVNRISGTSPHCGPPQITWSRQHTADRITLSTSSEQLQDLQKTPAAKNASNNFLLQFYP